MFLVWPEGKREITETKEWRNPAPATGMTSSPSVPREALMNGVTGGLATIQNSAFSIIVAVIPFQTLSEHVE